MFLWHGEVRHCAVLKCKLKTKLFRLACDLMFNIFWLSNMTLDAVLTCNQKLT